MMHLQHIYFFFLFCCSPAAAVFFSRFRLRVQQGYHRYITRHISIPAELRGGALEHPTSLSRLFFARGCVPLRCSSRAGAWKTPHIARSLLAQFHSPRFPAHRTASIISSIILPFVLSATTQQRQQQQQQHSLVTAMHSAFVCRRAGFCIYVGGVFAVEGTQNDQEKRWWVIFRKISRSAQQPKKQYTAAQQQCSSSGTTAAALQALAFVPGRSHGACACGWCTAAGDRGTPTCTRPTQQPGTHGRTSYQIYESTQQQQHEYCA